MQFDTNLNQIHVETWSTILRKFSTDPSLTDGSAYALTNAPFNYAGGQLIPAGDPRSSDFVLAFNFDQRFAVPEPATLSLLLLSGMALVRRRWGM